ncbi:MAG TPA: response regulator [Blastocatellia bacterium]|nr:response regulator [Blastocatellia bacterium]
MPKVLVVDDEPNIRWTMSEFLKREGYETLLAQDFDTALSAFEENDLDAAVIDIVLPRKSGIDILKELREREFHTPVIMITGEPNVSHIPQMVQSGAYDFISKPVMKDVLLRAVSKAVEKKRLEDEKLNLEQSLRLHTEQLETVVAERTRELAEAHNFLNTVLDSSTEYAIVAVNTEGRITLFNRGAELMSGFSAAEMIGRTAGELIDTGEATRWLDWRQIGEVNRFHQVEVELPRSDGSRFVGSVAVTPIREQEGESIGYLAIIRDLTAERRNEEALRRMQALLTHNEKIAALGRMAAQVAHEVRNPLAGLRLYSLHLKGKADGKLSPSEMSLIEKIIGGINHLSNTVDQVLNFARPLTLTPRRVDLSRIVNEAAQLLEPQLSSGRTDLKVDLPDEPIYAEIDEAAMRSTLINLMLNAVQAMPGGGELNVRAGAHETGIRIEVADTGCGMTAEQVEQVFEPFYTTKSQGLGLGLSYALKVIEKHGGSVNVGTEVGRGTRITITLPGEGSHG